MVGKSDMAVHEANMRAASDSFFERSNYEGIDTNMPFDELLAAEEELPDDISDEEVRYIRSAAIRALYRYLLGEGPHPLKVMKRLYAVGAGLLIEPFVSMTQEERAMMFSEKKASVSWRMKKLSGLIKRSGQRGSRLPGQKPESSTPNYSAAQMGHSNRRRKRRRKK